MPLTYLSQDQIEALINFADTNGDGEIDFEEYKEIMSFQSGVVTSNAAAPSASTPGTMPPQFRPSNVKSTVW